jgi:hypothetical protein
MLSDPHTLRTSRFLIPVTLLLIAAIMVAQFAIPFGWALAGLYIIPVSVCAFWSSFRHVFLVVWVATVCTILSTVIFFGSAFWDSHATMAMAYVLPVGSMWIIAILSVLRKALERILQRRTKIHTLCTSCRQIGSEGKMLSIEEFGHHKLGTFVTIGVCDGCAQKQGIRY